MKSTMRLVQFRDLRRLRIKAGASLADLSRWAQVSVNTIRKMERGGWCREDVASRIMSTLNHPNIYNDTLDDRSWMYVNEPDDYYAVLDEIPE